MVVLFICELKANLFSEPICIKYCLLKSRLDCMWLIACHAGTPLYGHNFSYLGRCGLL